MSFFVKPHIEEPDNHSAPDDIQHPGEDTHIRRGDAEERDPLLPTFTGTSQPDVSIVITLAKKCPHFDLNIKLSHIIGAASRSVWVFDGIAG